MDGLQARDGIDALDQLQQMIIRPTLFCLTSKCRSE